MNEEIEYAEMLEIPVSTVNVVRKNQRRKRAKTGETAAESNTASPTDLPANPLKESVIAQVNDRLSETPNTENPPSESELPLENPEQSAQEGRLEFEPIPERIDTLRLYSAEETGAWLEEGYGQNSAQENQNEGGRYAFKRKKGESKAFRIALNTEFVAACALCGAIFLTNVFMPTSAINTFFRSINNASSIAQTDARHYTDFDLTPVVSELSGAELSLSPTGILSFADDCCVYPAANGKIASVTQNANGSYTVKISHSDTFTGVFSGLDTVYYAEGEEVFANVPLGYTDGEEEVQVTMYSGGVLLNCFELTEENCLAWVEETK